MVDHLGKQVLAACLYLRSKGYGDVSQLQGGVKAWKDSGYPLEK